MREALVAQHLDSQDAQDALKTRAQAAAIAKLEAEEKARRAALQAQKEVEMEQAAVEVERLAHNLNLSTSEANTSTSDPAQHVAVRSPEMNQVPPSVAALSSEPAHHPSGTTSKRRYSVALAAGGLDQFLQTIELPDTVDEEAEETLNVVCPDGTVAGDTLYITTPDGEEVEIVVPEGVEPGDDFELDLSQLLIQTAHSDGGTDDLSEKKRSNDEHEDEDE